VTETVDKDKILKAKICYSSSDNKTDNQEKLTRRTDMAEAAG
jgi:hypothetical protein